MLDLWEPLRLHVFERRRGDNGESDQEDISLWVRQRAKTIIVLLTSSIPESEV